MLLAGDIGGTKSALALFSMEAGPRLPLKRAEFSSPEFPSLEAVVREFLRETSAVVDSACFGIAGPVVNRRVRATNLPWTIEEAALRSELGLSTVRLLNDVQATAQAIPSLQADEIETLLEGEAIQRGTIALVAPGTGLGEAFLILGRRALSSPAVRRRSRGLRAKRRRAGRTTGVLEAAI